MLPQSKNSLYFLVYLISFCNHSNSVDIGKVDVGTASSDVDYRGSFNINYQIGLYFPVFLYVIDSDTGNIVPTFPSTSVTVECGYSQVGSGYSQIQVTSGDFTIDSSFEGDLNFTITADGYGRPVDVFCWGQSFFGEPLFTNDTSVGKSGKLEVRKAGFVTICDPTVEVEEMAGNIFLVELSEPVQFGIVTITCANVSSGLGLSFDQSVVNVGGQRTDISYDFDNSGAAVDVECRAVTSGVGPEYLQFINDTSGSELSSFTIATGNISFRPNFLEVTGLNFTGLLALNPQPRLEVKFLCVVKVSNSLESANKALQDNNCERADTSGVWSLEQDTFVLNGDVYYAEVLAGRRNATQDVWPELVVVTCCETTDANGDPKYNKNQNVSLLAQVNYQGSVDYILNSDTDGSNLHPEPWYVELAPCPCDLTTDACDPGCCCDPTCSESSELYQCFDSYYGGQDPPPSQMNCSNRDPLKPPYWEILCIEISTNPLLGVFTGVSSLLTSSEDIDAAYQDHAPGYSYRQQEYATEVGSDTSEYIDGINLKTALENENDNPVISGSNYRLVLPHSVGYGQCDFSNPVRFLHDSTDSCVWQISETFCTSNSPLNSLNYARHTRGNGDGTCGKGLILLAAQRELGEIAETNVNYLCPQDISRYLVTSDTKVSRMYPATATNVTGCDFDPVSGAYICSEDDVVATADETPRCSFDDGYTKPPSPQFSGGVCQNAVLEVRYNFTWKGNKVVYLNATVVLGDVPATQNLTENVTVTYWNGTHIQETVESMSREVSVQLTQPTEVVFVHDFNTSIYDTSDPNVKKPYSSDQYERSGKQGYIDGLKVRSGLVVESGTATQVNQAQNLSLWGASLSCESASLDDILFNVDAYSGCMLYLTSADFLDCMNLRQFVLYTQDRLTRASVVGLGGDPDPNDLNNWRTVLREDISASVDSNNITEDFVLCTDIAAGIHINILYTKAGEAGGWSVHSIVSAQVKYIVSNWTFLGDSLSVQPFELTASVTFTKVPTDFSTRRPVLSDERSQEQTAGVGVCFKDACWRELLMYPWLPEFQGSLSFQLIWTGLLILVLSGTYLVVSRGKTYIRLLKLGLIYVTIVLTIIIVWYK